MDHGKIIDRITELENELETLREELNNKDPDIRQIIDKYDGSKSDSSAIRESLLNRGFVRGNINTIGGFIYPTINNLIVRAAVDKLAIFAVGMDGRWYTTMEHI